MIKTLITYTPGMGEFPESILSTIKSHLPELEFSYTASMKIGNVEISDVMRKSREQADGFLYFIYEHKINGTSYAQREAFENWEYAKKEGKFFYCVIIGEIELPAAARDMNFGVFNDAESQAGEIAVNILEYIGKYLHDTGKSNSTAIDLVYRAQELLRELGRYQGEVNGILDEDTGAAIVEYKLDNELKVSDIINQSVLANMELELLSAGKSERLVGKRKYWLYKGTKNEDLLPASIPNQTMSFLNRELLTNNSGHKVKHGDYILHFSLLTQSIKNILEVADFLLASDPMQKKLGLKPKRQLEKEIPLAHIARHIDFANDLQPGTKKHLFPITYKQYRSIIGTDSLTDSIERHSFQHEASYTSDVNFRETTDQLNFTNDIEAFANIISLKKVSPPLAIGLFGHWGSGKSFFMDKLSLRIDEIAEKKHDRYLHNIVQVKFNSWHYSDGNLWASLISHIFESLNDYATKKQFGKALVSQIYSKLEITSLQLKETQSKIDAKGTEVDQLGKSIHDLETQIRDKRDKLENLRIRDYFAIIKDDPQIAQKLGEIRDDLVSPETIQHIDDIDKQLKDVDTIFKQIAKTLKIVFTNSKANWIWLWLVFGFTIVGLIFINFGPIKDTLRELSSWICGLIGIVATAAAVIKQLHPYYKRVTQFYHQISGLKKAADIRAREIRMTEEDEKDKLHAKLNELATEKEREEAILIGKLNEKQELEKQIDDIGSGKLLSSFIAGKSADDNYIKNLGIISWIRKDFSNLSDLLSQQVEVNTTGQRANDGSEKVNIDRIVLYIDDLDRCSEQTVVKTLEAINLLLAFKLFVVVVGVDPRWLNNALTGQFGKLFGNEKNQAENTVTSYDYLEKIFQIPFALKPITDVGRRNLVEFLTKDDLETKTLNAEEIDSSNLNTEEQIQKSNRLYSILVDQSDRPVSGQEQPASMAEVLPGERVMLSELEVAFMQIVSDNFSTPRTIKRFVNIYRLIKAHRGYGFSEPGQYKATMLLLSIIIGCPQSAKHFIGRLHESGSDVEIRAFVMAMGEKSITSFFDKIPFKETEGLTTSQMKKDIDLISRFSFRTNLF